MLRRSRYPHRHAPVPRICLRLPGLAGKHKPTGKARGGKARRNGAGGRDSLPLPCSCSGLLPGFCHGTNWQEHRYPLGVLFSQPCNSRFINFLCHAVAHEEVRNRRRGPHDDNGEWTLLMTGKHRQHNKQTLLFRTLPLVSVSETCTAAVSRLWLVSSTAHSGPQTLTVHTKASTGVGACATFPPPTAAPSTHRGNHCFRNPI